MKNRSMLFGVVLSVLTLMAACGGGGGGGGSTPAVTSGTFVKEAAHTGAAGSGDIGGTPEGRYMMLYLASDIKASGMITSISFKRGAAMAAAVTCPNATVKMGHTSVNTLNATYANNVEQGQGSLQTVVNSAAVTVTAGSADEYFTFTFSEPFHYNGADNLVVEATRAAACSAAIPIRYHGANPAYNGIVSDGTSSTATIGWSLVSVADVKLNFTGGDVIAVPLNGGVNVEPFTNNSTSRKIQNLYRASEINGSGPITGIAFPVAGIPSTEEAFTINVKLGHSILTTLTTTFADNFNTGTPVLAANAVSFTVPAGIPIGSYVWIPLPNGPFNYNGTDNLIVEIEVTSATGQIQWGSNGNIGGSRLTGVMGAQTGTVDTVHYAIKFRFAGTTVDGITPGGFPSSYPFRGATSTKVQYLYRVADLGAKGAITKVAFRLTDNPTTWNYSDITVVLGHTSNNTLGATFSGNMSDAQTVFSGPFSVPAGLKPGDWIEIPLSTAFAYDGVRSLVIQASAPQGGPPTHHIRAAQDASRYAGRCATADSSATDTATVGNLLADVRLTIQ